MNRKIELSYIAGVLDSDGWFCIVRDSKRRNPMKACYSTNIGISQKEDDAILLAYKLFGGTVRYQDFKNYKRYSSCQMYQWVLSGNKLTKALRELIPYLRIKRDRAIISLKLRENIESLGSTGRKIPEFVREERYQLYLKMINLNGYKLAETESEEQETVCDSPNYKDGKLVEIGRNDQSTLKLREVTEGGKTT